MKKEVFWSNIFLFWHTKEPTADYLSENSSPTKTDNLNETVLLQKNKSWNVNCMKTCVFSGEQVLSRIIFGQV